MSRLHTGTVSRPRFESAPYRQSPGRREFVHGRIRPANDNSAAYGGRIGLAIMIAAPVLIFGGFFVIGRLF